MELTGRIIEWNRERGFGYLSCDKRRLFLHIRDFKERHKLPEVGDEIRFTVGTDKQDRSCAKSAIHVNARGRIRAYHYLILILLILPGYAVYRLHGQLALGYAAGWMFVTSAFTYYMYAWDKQQAQARDWRVSESMLHGFELLGGWAGAFFAQRRLRHKSAKGTYQFVFILIIGLHQFLAIDALRGWPFLRLLAKAVQKLV